MKPQNQIKINNPSLKLKSKIQANKKASEVTPFFKINLINYFILFFGAILLYGWSYTFHAGLDDSYIYAPLNNVENNFKGLLHVFTLWYSGLDYRPVTMLTFWLQRFILGDIQPGPSHIINVFIYSILLITIYRFILVSKFYLENDKLKIFALLAALIFLVHPNHVSVVANVKSRDNLLSMLFGLLSTIQFLKSYDNKQWWRLIFTFIFFALAILSKLDSYVFAFLPVMVLFFFRDSKIRKILLYVALSLLLYFIIMRVRDSMMNNLLDEKESQLYIGVDPSENPLVNQFTFSNRVSLLCTTLLYYVKFLVLPFGYYFYYGFDQIQINPLIHPLNIFAVLLFIVIMSSVIYFYKQNKIYLFSIIFFLISIAYAANFFIPVAGIVMDRYNFIPSLGFCLALSALFIDVTHTKNLNPVSNKIFFSLLLIYTCFTVSRTADWKDELTLYENDIKHLKKSFNANRIIAGVYVNRALQEDMKPNANHQFADDYMLKGESYANKAIAIYDKTGPIWVTKGIIELYFKRYDKGIEMLYTALRLDTTDYSAMNYLGVAYMYKNNFDSAYYYYVRSMQNENTFGFGAKNLINLLNNNKQKYKADSIINALNNRFPDNLELKQIMIESNPNANGADKSILFK